MQIPVVDTAGKEVSTIELPASIFEAKVNVGLMHQALVRQLANARRGTHKAKGRSEVARTTAKIYRQKGTGNARHGSRRAPIFVGGGVAHGPLPRDYSKKMPRKMRRAALRSALTVKAIDGNIVVVDDIQMDAPKTKEMNNVVRMLVGDSSALLIIPGRDVAVEGSARNLSDVKALHAPYLNIRDLLGHEKLIMTSAALDVLVEILATDTAVMDETVESEE
ncbi:MAG: 50S ribosomal protein L4 [Anaerolineales bacterium]|nr:50S ribosomal protein L4 [Anaerolineales bacterium]